jgi:hypothetical protein
MNTEADFRWTSNCEVFKHFSPFIWLSFVFAWPAFPVCIQEATWSPGFVFQFFLHVSSSALKCATIGYLQMKPNYLHGFACTLQYITYATGKDYSNQLRSKQTNKRKNKPVPRVINTVLSLECIRLLLCVEGVVSKIVFRLSGFYAIRTVIVLSATFVRLLGRAQIREVRSNIAWPTPFRACKQRGHI